MTTDKALDLLATHVAYLNGNVEAHDAPSRHKLQQALQALERFRGAVVKGSESATVEPLTKLEQFTLAAMQGLCGNTSIPGIPEEAVWLAKATLKALKEQGDE